MRKTKIMYSNSVTSSETSTDMGMRAAAPSAAVLAGNSNDAYEDAELNREDEIEIENEVNDKVIKPLPIIATTAAVTAVAVSKNEGEAAQSTKIEPENVPDTKIEPKVEQPASNKKVAAVVVATTVPTKESVMKKHALYV